MKVRVWLIAADDSSGTWAHAFATEREAYKCQAEAVGVDRPETVDLAMRIYDIHEEDWHDSFEALTNLRKSDLLDSYSITYEDIEVPEPLPPEMKLLETVADIAYLAGARRYHSGDSRADVQTFIQWAREFEDAFTPEDNEQFKYIEAIEAFTQYKLINSGHLPEPSDLDPLPGGGLLP